MDSKLRLKIKEFVLLRLENIIFAKNNSKN